MQNVMVTLRGMDGERVVAVSYHDAWDENRGRITVLIGETPYDGPNDLPHSGEGSLEIRREAGLISVTWGGEEVLTGTVATPVQTSTWGNMKVLYR